MSRRARQSPAALSPGWPDRLSPDPDAEAVRLLVLAVRDSSAGLSLRQLAGKCDLSHAALSSLLAGETWPDVRTLSRLERGLEASLWPVLGPAGTHVAAASDVVVGEGAEQVDDRRTTGRGEATT